MRTLTYYRGDTVNITLNFANADVPPVPWNISGWEIFLTLKGTIGDLDAAAAVQVNQLSHINPALGQTILTIDKSLTANLLGSYRYDIQAKKKDGTVYTVLEGYMTFKPDVTIRNS